MGRFAFLALLSLLPLAPHQAHAAPGDSLGVSFDTSTLGGKYGPRNIVAVWVEDAQGTFIKTIGRWSNTRTRHLVNWVAASGQDTDAVSGATRSNHGGRLSLTWDLLDRAGNPVPLGSYSIKVEVCEDNTQAGNLAGNSVQALPFVLDESYRSESGLGGGNVTNATIDYLGNGGAPVSCEADGVCGQGCGDTDPDCADGTVDEISSDAGGSKAVTGGCHVSRGTPRAPFLLIFGLLLVFGRRRTAKSRRA